MRKFIIVAGFLFFGSAVFVFAQSAANPFACATPRPEVKVGSKSTCVQRIKWFLNNGLTDPKPNFDLEGENATLFDATTQAAVQRWQRAKTLNCTEGVVGPETWNSFEPDLKMTGPCVDGTVKTGDDKSGAGNEGVAGGVYSNALTKECQELSQNFSDFGGSIPGSLPAYCYSPGQGVTKIIRLVFAFLGMLAVLFIVIGGYRYITSGGDDKKATQGKKTIQWALVGLAVALSAYAIVSIATRFAITSSIL
ncbi:MAG: peptidoglycan-binding protein [Candidatus Doudnabacteria bacterium]|nr:peptidoglycan-binding protein [Candidatus Doudnabacteria bacterium]